MSQPVKLSDEIVLDARQVASVSQRSIAGQIEFWAQLGRAIEPLLDGARALALRRTGQARPLSELMMSVDSAEGRDRVLAVLQSGPFPRYESVPDMPGSVVRIQADGTRTTGRFVGRTFQPNR